MYYLHQQVVVSHERECARPLLQVEQRHIRKEECAEGGGQVGSTGEGETCKQKWERRTCADEGAASFLICLISYEVERASLTQSFVGQAGLSLVYSPAQGLYLVTDSGQRCATASSPGAFTSMRLASDREAKSRGRGHPKDSDSANPPMAKLPSRERESSRRPWGRSRMTEPHKMGGRES